jgi:urocanate hydratase
MSGAQPKAGNIAGVVSVTAEVNPAATYKRHEQGWVDEVISDLDELVVRVKKAKENKEVVSIAYDGNIVDVWEKFDQEDVYVDLDRIRHLFIIHGQEDITLQEFRLRMPTE